MALKRVKGARYGLAFRGCSPLRKNVVRSIDVRQNDVYMYLNKQGDTEMQTRNELETKTVATLKNLLAMPRKRAALSLTALEAHYGREMEKMGYTNLNQIYRAWRDCLDMAELEMEAA